MEEKSWVKKHNLDCDRLLDAFEHTPDKFIGMKIDNGLPKYQLLFKSNETREIEHGEARSVWLDLLTNFLEEHLVWNHGKKCGATTWHLAARSVIQLRLFVSIEEMPDYHDFS